VLLLFALLLNALCAVHHSRHVAVVPAESCALTRASLVSPTRLPAHIDNGRTLLIGIVIDTHPQQRNVIAFERHVMDSLADVLAGSDSKGFVISYSDRVQPIADWSGADSGLREAAARIALDDGEGAHKPRGAVLNDGLLAGLTRLGSAASGVRKGLIVIGEGNDGGSTAQFSQLRDVAKDRQIQCFALLVANHRSQVGRVRQFGFDLYRLATGTKGGAYDVRTDPRLLDEALKDVVRRLTSAGGRPFSAERDVTN
jgi:hypothetical protein